MIIHRLPLSFYYYTIAMIPWSFVASYRFLLPPYYDTVSIILSWCYFHTILLPWWTAGRLATPFHGGSGRTTAGGWWGVQNSGEVRKSREFSWELIGNQRNSWELLQRHDGIPLGFHWDSAGINDVPKKRDSVTIEIQPAKSIHDFCVILN